MAKVETEILASKPQGDADSLRNHIKAIESSLWYESAHKSAKEAKERRWCDNCKSSTHDTAQCRGCCEHCNKFGQQNSENKNISESAKTVKTGDALEPEEVKRLRKRRS